MHEIYAGLVSVRRYIKEGFGDSGIFEVFEARRAGIWRIANRNNEYPEGPKRPTSGPRPKQTVVSVLLSD